jgi:outer membrane protein assembly factor BamB
LLTLVLATLFLCFNSGRLLDSSSEALNYWPQWRGPLMTGEAPLGDPPIRWSENDQIRWKVPIPGIGHATPVVWGDHIYVLSAVPAKGKSSTSSDPRYRMENLKDKYSYEVLAMNRKDGSLFWRRVARVEAPHDGRHSDASWASCSPVTDGEHIIASFGSRGFYCYDMEGSLQWEKDFGDLSIRYSWGEGSSPALSDDKLIVTWDQTGNSFIVVLDKRTGRELWRKNRNDGTSWTTPLVVEHNGRKQIVAPSISRTRAYDLETGKEIWTTRGMTANPIPTPVSANGIVYLMGGYRESVLQAISLDRAHGRASSSGAIVWEHAWDTPYVPSPLLYGGKLYFLKSNMNILTCLNAATGESYYSRQRLQNIQGVYASPVAAKDRVYVVGRNGVCAVIRHGPRFEVLATNRLDDSFSASPVIVGKDMYLRGHKYLYCITSK